MDLFKSSGSSRKASFFQGNVEVPVKLLIAKGKHHVVGIVEFGDKSYAEERRITFLSRTDVTKEVATSLLKKVGLNDQQISEILNKGINEIF